MLRLGLAEGSYAATVASYRGMGLVDRWRAGLLDLRHDLTLDLSRLADARLARARSLLARVDGLLVLDDRGLAARLLPLGTRVRLGDAAVAECSHFPAPAPMSGTVGVVAGYALGRANPLVVALPRHAASRDGRTPLPFTPSRPWRYALGADHVEFVGHGTLPDGTGNAECGFLPTHFRPRVDTGVCMLVDAEGSTWRIALLAGNPDLFGVHPGGRDLAHLRPIRASAMAA